MTTPQAAAMEYAHRGWAVVPLSGKIPIIKDWTNAASTDPDQIRSWWVQNPTANVGIATGARSRLFVLDVDPDKGGDDSLRNLEEQYGPLPPTTEAISGGEASLLFSASRYFAQQFYREAWPRP